MEEKKKEYDDAGCKDGKMEAELPKAVIFGPNQE